MNSAVGVPMFTPNAFFRCTAVEVAPIAVATEPPLLNPPLPATSPFQTEEALLPSPVGQRWRTVIAPADTVGFHWFTRFEKP